MRVGRNGNSHGAAEYLVVGMALIGDSYTTSSGWVVSMQRMDNALG